MKMKKFTSFLLHGKHTSGTLRIEKIDVNQPISVVKCPIFVI